MFISRSIAFVALFCIFVLAAACGGQNQLEQTISPTEIIPSLQPTAVSQAPQIFVIPKETEKRLITTELVPQNNCDGSAETSDTVERSHAVLRTLELGSGITVDAEGRAGIPGVGEVGVGMAVAAYYQVGYGTTDTITRSTTVAAREGTHIQHTIQHFEIWEKGELIIVVGSISQQIPYSFRKDFSLEKLPPANVGCSGQQVVQPQQPTAEAITETTVQPGLVRTEVVPTTESAPGNKANTFSVNVPIKSYMGESWTAPATGLYTIGIESGAYNPWPSDSDCPGCWRTRINAYVGCEIKRELSPGSSEMEEPVDPSFTLGNFTNMESLQSAESFAKSMAPSTVSLNQGDCVRFVTIDGLSIWTDFSAYEDNRGPTIENPMITLRIIGPQ